MATIQTKTTYNFQGKDYESIEALKTAITDLIGFHIIDKVNGYIPAKHALQIVDLIIKNRLVLDALLNQTIENADGDEINILAL